METAVRNARVPVAATGDNRAMLRKALRSRTGFRAETAFSLRAGTTVWITLPGLQGLEAEIAWQRGEHIGAAFRQPLHAAVFEHIVELGR